MKMRAFKALVSAGLAVCLLASSNVASAANDKAAAGKLALPQSLALKHVRAAHLRGQSSDLVGTTLVVVLLASAAAVAGIVAVTASTNSN